jgi:hypothetical protein
MEIDMRRAYLSASYSFSRLDRQTAGWMIVLVCMMSAAVGAFGGLVTAAVR